MNKSTCLNCEIDNTQCYECYILSGNEQKDIYKLIDDLQQWLRENQVRATDDVYKMKFNTMQNLMNQAYTTTTIRG